MTLKVTKIRLFADNCVLYRDVTTIEDYKVLKDDLSTLEQWSNTWQLKFNVNKCKVMCISAKKLTQTLNYKINNNNLEVVSVLGVVIDSKLAWRDQVNHATSKATEPPKT